LFLLVLFIKSGLSGCVSDFQLTVTVVYLIVFWAVLNCVYIQLISLAFESGAVADF